VRQAQSGFPMGARLASGLYRTSHQVVRLLFGRETYAENDLVRRFELASTLRRWAATAGEDLHTGVGAKAVVSEVQAAGGRLTFEDLANYKVAQRDPIVINYRGYTVITMPPPSSGGIVLAQVLRVLEGYELSTLGHNSADYVHLITEAMKHAYADRAHYLGDADFVDVPVQELISDARVREVRGELWPGRTFEPAHYGLPVAPPQDAGTQHISVLDAFGGAVALTTTINTSFGSGVVVEQNGMVLNNEMDDFSAAPGVPNAYGLIGGEENAIEPGKRPLSSMSPTVLIGPTGKVEMVGGASGGSKIISATLQAILNRVEFGMDAQDAVAAPRFHHQWQPNMLALEFGISPDTADALEARGHKVIRMATRAACDTGKLGFAQCFHASVQMVARESEGVVAGAADPRKGGRAVAVKDAN
ncbi:MAG: gamma-glutamyltransferase, partial [Rhodobacterales bacterium]|nr:gamma-glutamyltransferase [Rhodobacterales bacterium]